VRTYSGENFMSVYSTESQREGLGEKHIRLATSRLTRRAG